MFTTLISYKCWDGAHFGIWQNSSFHLDHQLFDLTVQTNGLQLWIVLFCTLCFLQSLYCNQLPFRSEKLIEVNMHVDEFLPNFPIQKEVLGIRHEQYLHATVVIPIL